jgi:uncharacterized membrane protein YhaH (DUF805 family)
MNWYLAVWKKYAVFAGRARRKEYWHFWLFNILITLVLGIITTVMGFVSQGTSLGLIGSGLLCVYGLAVLIPGIAVSVRRLHDTGKSGWWLLIGLVPFVGGIVLLVFMVQDSQRDANQYGLNPKMAGA